MSLPETNKSLGQHWLSDVKILEAIADEADVTSGDTVVEIGPGPGTLTKVLINRGVELTAVEFDGQLARALKIKYPEINVVSEDILKFDFTSIESPYKVVANIPYYLTSKLIRVLSESQNPPEIAVLLIQKEVAQRVAAPAGKMSMLSVSAQYYWEVSTGIEVLAKMFTPPPKVDSQTVILHRRKKPLFGDIDEKKFFRIVKSGYSNRRKTLHNSLSAGLQITKEQTKLLLDNTKINSSARPQELSLDQWYKLYKAID